MAFTYGKLLVELILNFNKVKSIITSKIKCLKRRNMKKRFYWEKLVTNNNKNIPLDKNFIEFTARYKCDRF